MSDSGIVFDPKMPMASIGDIGSLEFDVLVDESHDWSNEVTSNPVENGSPVSDHIIPNSDKLKLTIMISDSSLYDDLVEGEDKKTQKAFDILRQLHEAREPLIVYTKYFLYLDMAISHIGISRSSRDGNSLTIPIEFVNVRLVETQTVKVPAGISKKLDKKSTDAVQKKTEPQKNTGAKQPVVPATPEKRQSVLSGLLGGA